MMQIALFAALAAGAIACTPRAPTGPTATAPVAAPVAGTARPFAAMPTVALVDHTQEGPSYRVQIIAEITRDVMPTDDLAIVVSVGENEVARYPIVGMFDRAARTTRIKQEIELPLGDYELDYAYQGQKFAGMPFRLAEVPVWGGRKALQLRQHPGTRVSLREGKLWVGRWWANDGPPRAWIVEWVHEGKVATTTSGREQRGIPPHASRVVGGAAGAYRDSRVVNNTVWTYGEQYPLPAMVARTPGVWAARVVHGSSAPVAVVFSIRPDGKLVELSARRVHAAGWEPSWSRRLEQRALAVTEVERLTAKLPHASPSQPFDEVPAQTTGEAPLRISTAAVRALFRSKQVAELWWSYYELAATPAKAKSAAPASAQAPAFPKASKRTAGLGEKRDAAAAAKEDADRRLRQRALRAQIETLIKAHGGAWKPDEFPRS
jgi:hypothetical protein